MSKTTSAISGGLSGAAAGTTIGGPGIGTAIGAVVGGLAGFLGGGAGDEKRAAAERAANEAFAMIASMDLAPDESKALLLEKLKQAGVYTPQMEENLAKLPDSDFEKIKTDPKLKTAQMEALQTLQKNGRVGLGPQERAALAEAQDQEARIAQGRAGQITQQMAARGLGGSGAELAQQIQNQQSSANRGSLDALKAGGMAAQNALEAARSSGALATQVDAQNYNQAAMKAQSQDAIKKFNTQNAIESARRNTQSQNQAQLTNLAEQQRVQDANSNMDNAEQVRESNARRQKWLDDMARTQALANARMGQATQLNTEASGQEQGFNNVLSGVGQAASAYGVASMNASKTPKKLDSTNVSGGETGSGYSNPVYAAEGGLVLGKAEVPGDSIKNDKIPAMLSPGEIVVPRHVLAGDKPGYRTKQFVDAMLSLHELKHGKKNGI